MPPAPHIPCQAAYVTGGGGGGGVVGTLTREHRTGDEWDGEDGPPRSPAVYLSLKLSVNFVLNAGFFFFFPALT